MKYKKQCGRVLGIILSALLLIPSFIGADTGLQLKITTPSAKQSQIAPARDFYVLGEFVGQVPQNSSMQFELYKQGESKPIRALRADGKYKAENFFTSYSNLSYYGKDRKELSTAMMPDLVYDARNSATFRQVWRKCCFSDRNFSAVFAGGEYNRDLDLQDEQGKKLLPLTPGVYNIKVKLLHKGKVIAESDKNLHVDYCKNKILSRFSPPKHFARIKKFAEQNKYQTFLDLFPGYWSPKNNLKGFENSNIFAEILPRWRLADAQEYDFGKTHMFLYNISPKSATYSVEIGRLTYKNKISDPNYVKAYYYNIGEPELQNGKYEGELVQLADADTLEFTRADLQPAETEDNVLSDSDLNNMQSDLNVYDGISVKKGEDFALNGVVRPIANKAEDVSHNVDETYTIKNKIDSVEYKLLMGNKEKTWHKKVGLIRRTSRRADLSVVEFRHIIHIDKNEQANKAELIVKALDSYGNFVPGSEEILHLQLN